MDGDGGEAVEPRGRGATGIDLPAVLTRLDGEPSEQRAAVNRIRTAIDERDGAAGCAPTVPKLRSLLERPEIDFRETVAACLADLAAEAPTDVAPSTGSIVAVARDDPDRPMTGELLRCLAAVAAERPDVVVDHTVAIADVLEQRSDYDTDGLDALAHVSRVDPMALEPAVSVLKAALSAAPAENGRPALRALGRLARSEGDLGSLAFVSHAAALVDHENPAVRHEAIGCLGDVAHHDPAAVESVTAELGTALSCDDPDTRAAAAVTIARIAAGTETAVDPVRRQLLSLLADDHAHVRANACVALGHGGVEAAEPRLADLASRDPAPNVRDRASWAAGRLS
ncbi:hypothetical protein C478_06401 [Natrinema thermotolerans DSM 11552]|uniref:HEAT repeat domain-containing protein n=1 Tax=Natrinema sp. H-ect1 TaxID=3242700 RepID=UPI0002AF604F|nr:hypothetical protein C478_06401 [Natrinema thermotolerans DSM 11552]